MPRFPVILLALCTATHAVEIRVATYNVGARFSEEGYPDYGIGDPGSPDHDKVAEILNRINADVVALQEISSTDVSGNPDDLDALRATTGYPYSYISPTSSSGGQTGPFDTSLRVVFLSKYPLVVSDAIRSPAGARELTRLHPVVKVDVPGTTRDPFLISAHLKSGTAAADQFRRAIEMRRLAEHVTTLGLTEDDNFILLGDFNLSANSRTFTSAPSGLPGTYSLGTDVSYPVSYSTNPLAYFSNPSPVRLDPRQLNGSNRTFGTTGNGITTIDLMLVSPAFAGRPLATEIYNSALDTSNTAGLPKAGNPLASDTSSLASDHHIVFADLELDEDFPNLDLTITPASVPETSSSGTSNLRIAIPATRGSALTVNLSSDNPDIARPTQATATISAGSLFTTVPIQTSRNFMSDEGNSVAFTATATGYDPDTAVLNVTDTEATYTFTSLNQTISEAFTNFGGTHDPAPWITSGTPPWIGNDDGSSTAPGFRSYGGPSNPSAGFLPDGTSPSTLSATYRNQSSQTLTALAVSLKAFQWRAGSTPDKLFAAVITPSFVHQIPNLTFTPSTAPPNGPVNSPSGTTLSATVDGLSIPPGQSFDLRFTFTPGSGGGTLPSDVFINEFHYDNASIDENEFVEIVVGPGYSGPLSNLRLYLYNGSNGTVYNNTSGYPLNDDLLGSTTSSGHRIFSLMIPDIQNGNPDGFAVVNGTQVLHFISYGGTFTATNGPASGMTSVDVGFTQPPSTPVNTNSIRLIGTGSTAAGFTWTKTAIPHSPGAANDGQTFTAPSQAHGISIDDIAVTFLPPDVDSDGDGFTDRIEQNLLLTNPNNPSSKFAPVMTLAAPATARLSFPTLSGRRYLIQTSGNLTQWQSGSSYSGNGSVRNIDIPIVPGAPKLFHRVVVSFE